MSKAKDVLGDRKGAEKCMVTPALGLEGRKPIDLSSTQVSYDLVDDFPFERYTAQKLKYSIILRAFLLTMAETCYI